MLQTKNKINFYKSILMKQREVMYPLESSKYGYKDIRQGQKNDVLTKWEFQQRESIQKVLPENHRAEEYIIHWIE